MKESLTSKEKDFVFLLVSLLNQFKIPMPSFVQSKLSESGSILYPNSSSRSYGCFHLYIIVCTHNTHCLIKSKIFSRIDYFDMYMTLEFVMKFLFTASIEKKTERKLIFFFFQINNKQKQKKKQNLIDRQKFLK